MRRPAAKTKPRKADEKSFPTLVRGWIANEALSSPQPGGAARLENFFPTATDVRMRAGNQLYATVGAGTGRVGSLFSYVTGTISRLFSAFGGAIYDMTTVPNPLVSPAPAVSGLLGSDWSVVQFQTPGGVFLRMVNGLDDPRLFDGTAFATTAPITATGLNPKDLVFVWAYKKRLFFIEKNSMNAWYLDVENLGGAATKLPLGANFNRGGKLIFGAAWSIDSGAGLSEQCAFMTSEGEVVIYTGENPGDATAWKKVGLYQIGRPLGANAVIRGGGDLIICTDIGFVPLSQAIQKDTAALSPAAVSYPIETEWNERVKLRSSAPWVAEVWPTKQMVVIALPTVNDQRPEMLVANARTGAWALYSGWDASCVEVFGGRLFFGTTGGRVIEAEVGGMDVGEPGNPSRPYTAVAVPLFDGLRAPTAVKEAGMARAVVRSPGDAIVKVSALADYVVDLPVPPDAAASLSGSIWGVGTWGTSTWGTEAVKVTSQDWQSVAAVGYALSAAVQITSGSVAPPEVDLLRIDLTYQVGDI